MNISTKTPQSLKWVTFSVFLLVIFTTHNLYADDPGIDPIDENQRFIEIGTCHTENFPIPLTGTLVPEWFSSIIEVINSRHSIRHEEPYIAITAGYKPDNKTYLAGTWRQRAFDTGTDLGLDFYIHVAYYFLGKVMYIPGRMINDTHLPEVLLDEGLRNRKCTFVRNYPEADTNKQISEGNVPLFGPRYAHVRFLQHGWEGRSYHLFLRNCQHWTDFVIHGYDYSGMRGLNLWGFGQAVFYLPPWVVAAILLL